MMERKIAIVGANSKIRPLAPFDDRSWEIWTFSPHNLFTLDRIPRFDRWFELHCPLVENVSAWPGYLEFLRSLDSVTVRDMSCGLPNARPYPESEMLARFGPYFFSSTIAWLMALAIFERPAMLGLWLSDYGPRSRYRFQLPGVRYFAQRAREKGIDLYSPPESRALYVPAFYGGPSIGLEAA